ncbi:ribosomal protein L24 [Nesidiocoris tenuis]|uniref:Large ribosomal subunit protein uL24m n=1 Tax=Nesidiocoris tenuis TaxID=355587 RepID=A0ABN7B6I1_9HEMI|nr:ribosomal protein L24 [Nesidiocoris tenuis]
MRFSQVLSKITKEGIGELTKKQANLPESYVRRTLQSVEWRNPRGYPQYMPKQIVKKKTYYNVEKPWTAQFQQNNAPNVRHRKVFVEPVLNWSFFVGDRVEILTGPDKGKQGTICEVIEERNWVLVEGLNLKLKSMGKTKNYPGSVIGVEQPLLINHEVSLVDPADLQSTQIEWRYTEEGEKVRVSTRTGRIIPVPIGAEATHDYKTKGTYVENKEKDTTDKDLTEITFKPTLSTFEMDVMKAEGIVETRTPSKTYWY